MTDIHAPSPEKLVKLLDDASDDLLRVFIAVAYICSRVHFGDTNPMDSFCVEFNKEQPYTEKYSSFWATTSPAFSGYEVFVRLYDKYHIVKFSPIHGEKIVYVKIKGRQGNGEFFTDCL